MLGRLRLKKKIYFDTDQKKEDLQQHIIVAIQSNFRNLKKKKNILPNEKTHTYHTNCMDL